MGLRRRAGQEDAQEVQQGRGPRPPGAPRRPHSLLRVLQEPDQPGQKQGEVCHLPTHQPDPPPPPVLPPPPPPVVCGANQYVSSETCTACPGGSTNAAGDNPSGPNTTCECAVN